MEYNNQSLLNLLYLNICFKDFIHNSKKNLENLWVNNEKQLDFIKEKKLKELENYKLYLSYLKDTPENFDKKISIVEKICHFNPKDNNLTKIYNYFKNEVSEFYKKVNIEIINNYPHELLNIISENINLFLIIMEKKDQKLEKLKKDYNNILFLNNNIIYNEEKNQQLFDEYENEINKLKKEKELIIKKEKEHNQKI